jgi:SAM-dependent methyltransferase
MPPPLPGQSDSGAVDLKPSPNERRAQRGYYKLRGAAAALNDRLDAIRRHVLPGSVLDVGCNDGTLTRTLLSEGRVTQAQGIELEILHDHFPVLTGDILELPAACLAVFDNVLYLNIHHHLIAATHGSERQDRPDRILDTLLAGCRRLFFEMGSVTEQGGWSWLKILRRRFGSDEQAVQALFGGRLYFEILRYPMQGGVRRMFMIAGNAPDQWEVTQVQWYARNVAAYPPNKCLARVGGPLAFPPGPVGHAPRDWMPHVKFVTFQHDGRMFFGKLHDRRKYNVALTFKIYEQLRHTRFSRNIVHPLYFSTKYGLVWDYDPELMMAPFGNAAVVHLHDVPRAKFGLHAGSEREEIAALADSPIEIDGTKKRVREWCDFQTVRTSRGLRFIDFDAFGIL